MDSTNSIDKRIRKWCVSNLWRRMAKWNTIYIYFVYWKSRDVDSKSKNKEKYIDTSKDRKKTLQSILEEITLKLEEK